MTAVGNSNIAIVADYVAALAAGISGVKAVYGTGTGSINDPLRPGKKVQAAGSDPVEPFEHWTEVPAAPTIKWMTQSGLVELTWTIMSRLWLSREPVSELRRAALPFYDGYLGAFVRDFQLGGYVQRSELQGLSIGTDDDWAWLEVRLAAYEMVQYG